MLETFRVEWDLGSPFLDLIERFTARAASRWKGEPSEVLGDIWDDLRKHFQVGDRVDPKDPVLQKIIHQKVRSFYRPRTIRFESLDRAVESSRPGLTTLVDEVAFREFRDAIDRALTRLTTRQREAFLIRLDFGDRRSMTELARVRGTSSQNVRKLASEGRKKLQSSLARFDPRCAMEAAR